MLSGSFNEHLTNNFELSSINFSEPIAKDGTLLSNDDTLSLRL